MEVNAEKLIARRKSLEATLGKVSYNILIAEAAGKALKEFPYMNSRLSGDEIWEMKAVNIGIAVDTERGLLVPVVKDVVNKPIEVLHQEFSGLTERALAGRSTPQDLEGGTFHHHKPRRAGDRILRPGDQPAGMRHSGCRRDHAQSGCGR